MISVVLHKSSRSGYYTSEHSSCEWHQVDTR